MTTIPKNWRPPLKIALRIADARVDVARARHGKDLAADTNSKFKLRAISVLDEHRAQQIASRMAKKAA